MKNNQTKGIIFDIQRFCVHDGPGIRTTVFMKGCTLRCLWCHNPEGLRPTKELLFFEEKCLQCRKCEEVCNAGVHLFDGGRHNVSFEKCNICGACQNVCPCGAVIINGREIFPEELVRAVCADKIFYGEDGGVTFSGGEPLMQPDFISEACEIMSSKGIPSVCIDTSGNVPWENIEKVLMHADLFLYDIKAVSEDVFKMCTGSLPQLTLTNLKRLDSCIGKRSIKAKGIWIRIPVIPGYNDSNEEQSYINEFISELKNVKNVTHIPYHGDYIGKYATLGMQSKI